MPLKFHLRPGERLIINGAEVEIGGERRTSLIFLNEARVLKGFMILRKEDIHTSLDHLYYALQRMYVGTVVERDEGMRDYVVALEKVRSEEDPDTLVLLETIEEQVNQGKFYEALRELYEFRTSTRS